MPTAKSRSESISEEAKSTYFAVKKSGRVVQVGTQWRSEGHYMAAAELVQSGVLGAITRIDLSVNFQEPRWREGIESVVEADVDWKRYLFNRPFRPFDPHRFKEWQLYRDYTNGMPGLWMSHYINLVHWMMQDTYPASAVASGGIYLWKDGREHTDVFQALFEYLKGFHVSFVMSLTNGSGDRNLWCGTRGTLDLIAKKISGEGSNMPDRLAKETTIDPKPTISHMQNFLECVRSRESPRSDVQTGFSHAVACCMAATALETGSIINFPGENREIQPSLPGNPIEGKAIGYKSHWKGSKS